MSTFTFGSITVNIDPAYRALGGAMREMAKNVFSFQVKKLEEGSWYLITNRQNFIGRYPSQAACISVLYGIMTFNNGLDSGFEVWANSSINSGASVIDPDINVFTIEVAGVDPNQTLGGTVTSIDYSIAPAAGDYWFGYQNSTDSGSTWGVNGVASALIIGDRVTAGDGNQQTDTATTAKYDAFAEDTLMRGVLVERILTGNLGDATSLVSGTAWITTAVTGLPSTDFGISSLAGDTVAGTLSLTFGSPEAVSSFLANAVSVVINGDDANPILIGDFGAPSGNSITATGGNAALAASAVLALGNGATWDLKVVDYTDSIVGTSVNTIWKDDVDNTDISLLAIDISGTSTVGAPVELNGYSYAIPNESQVTLDPEEDITYTYAWYREIPTLTSITSS